MGSISRRSFVKCSAGVVAFTFADFQALHANSVKLSFSTLGCPDWSLDQVLDFAVKHHYSGIEIRGLQRELDLTKSRYFNTPQAIKETKRKLSDKGIAIVGLGSSAAMHHADAAERTKAFDEAEKFIDLAEQVGSPYVRVFPDKLPKEQDKQGTLNRIADGLNELGRYARNSQVGVLMETHGDLVYADDLVKVMNSVAEENVGLVWDISNMWMVTKEAPAKVYPKLSKWIRHTHLKDLKMANDKAEYTLMGEGEVPIFSAIDLLVKGGYKGYYSFEWEKLWHPEIAEPEVAFAQYSSKIIAHTGNK